MIRARTAPTTTNVKGSGRSCREAMPCSGTRTEVMVPTRDAGGPMADRTPTSLAATGLIDFCARFLDLVAGHSARAELRWPSPLPLKCSRRGHAGTPVNSTLPALCVCMSDLSASTVGGAGCGAGSTVKICHSRWTRLCSSKGLPCHGD